MTHEPTPDCWDVHCYSCNDDEDEGYAYLICGECGHRYRTAGELRRAYRGQFYRTARMSVLAPPCDDDGEFTVIDAGRMSLWRVWWAMATIRAKHIYFCQHCTHDF